MISWGLPLIHVVVLFSSTSQVLFIILGSKPPYLCRCLGNCYIKFGREPTLRTKKQLFSTPPAVKLKLVTILSTLWGLPLIHVVVPFCSVLQVLFIILGSKPPYLHRMLSWELLYKIWRGTNPPEPKSSDFYTPSCQTEVSGHIGYVKEIQIMTLLGKSLCTDNYDFYTH